MEWVIGFFVLWLLSLFDRSETSATKDSKPNDKAENTDTLKISQERINKLLEQLEEEREQPKEKKVIKSGENDLTPEQQEIKEFVEERNISQLIHFTRYENLESIFTNGLITRDGLNNFNYTTYVNDVLRLDGHTNSISLSLSFPNYRMFYKYRMNTEAQGWVILAISPEILWDYGCAFCKHNAADSRISNREINDLSGINSFREMFSDDIEESGTRSEQRLENFDTTDPQAEVLVFKNIPTKYILAVGFENQNLLLQTSNQQDSSHIKFVMAEKYFNSRGYVR